MSTSFVGVEVLEDRRLLSAAPHSAIAPHAKLSSIPAIVGVYAGTAFFSSGISDSISITVAKQHGMAFSGTTIQGLGPTGKIAGTVSRKGVVHAVLRGTNLHFVSTIKGTYSTGSLQLSFKTIQQKLHLSGTLDLSRVIE